MVLPEINVIIKNVFPFHICIHALACRFLVHIIMQVLFFIPLFANSLQNVYSMFYDVVLNPGYVCPDAKKEIYIDYLPKFIDDYPSIFYMGTSVLV
jgi:hypothetical protein